MATVLGMPGRRARLVAYGLLGLLTALPASAGAQTSDAARFASMQSQILQLQEELRRTTGRIEELDYQNRQLEQRMDRLVADLDRRLEAFERTPREEPGADAALDGRDGLAETTREQLPTVYRSGEPSPPGPTTAEPARTAAEPAPAPARQRPGNGAEPPAVLGTIPRDALLGVPRPSEGAAGGDASAAAAARADVPANALEGSPESRFAAAMQLLQAGNLAAAEVAFARFERDFPDAPQAPTAAYWVGETFYTRGQYADAAATFARNYRQYGAEAERAPENLLKLGMSLAALGDAEKACASYDELERRFPDAGTAVRQTLERERRSAGCG